MNPETINVAPESEKDEAIVDIFRTCIHCRQKTIFKMTDNQYYNWIIQNNYIQDVFPHLSIQDREQMISGTHPSCWNEMFPEDLDED